MNGIRTKIESLSALAPTVLRVALSAVYLWFGFSQILNSQAWTAFIPEWAVALSGLEALTVVHLNGVFEIVAGFLLVFGVAVRPVATLLFLHLAVITFDLGWGPIGVRDFGLSFATLAVALYGPDAYSLSDSKAEDPTKGGGALPV